VGDQKFYVINDEDDNENNKKLSLKTAQYFLNDRKLKGEYNAIKLNYETFGTYCRTGEARSIQAEKLIEFFGNKIKTLYQRIESSLI